MKSLKESLFDDDLATKPLLNWNWFKMPRNERSVLFYEIFNIMFSPDDYIPRWVLKHYELHKLQFDYIIQCLRSAFKKQSYVSWFYIDSNDMEMIGDEMTEEQITKANNEMRSYFSKGVYTTRGIFIMGDEKIPACIKDLIKKTDHWNRMLSTTKEWAIEYYDDGTMMIFVCPKDLDPDIKKLLYD